LAVLSIDSREGPALAAAKKVAYLERYEQTAHAHGLRFLTGDEAAITALARDIGFHYQYDEERNEFAHPSGIVVLTPSGVISRYLFGIEFMPHSLRLAIVEASAAKVGGIIDQFMLYCYRYDPVKGAYGLYIYRVVQSLGAATVFVLALVIFHLSRSERERRRHLPNIGGLR
jgi:protein SCO1/2